MLFLLNIVYLVFICVISVNVCVLVVEPVVSDDVQKCNTEFMQRSEVCMDLRSAPLHDYSYE